ncbi:hypothetical protein PSN45_005227 [Yamadazyma tenuis]|uniref:DUF1682-domain-containing protein n=1 Tax=Candida tenuis (strain ATCC 10573 / BCRC 21748 / CBS 615 / JCM 9827 / NBRC 10315 / NRRL Y-1498 / VKM Y-70) TaxID=590646 RepID=G3B144_CANTC|nr:DUF1682-domain-containing protein [Yamadazyma tenuis ATCC 10573]XP_006685969.1 uncharacterized protein CANTEDRAFT_113637 [Yamadazyma tenuis ATCC 10573]EGV65162.1 DUF1682-domain-containing protein [Yamadazyma tenuis ATCC 10573]EGV65163.1 hypothetical protein CANTEDRAFT_113637 [Yamadazyma tenuis ATCC 10573]WEJ97669.1 hypothetical protein PSN45_005227 [Yamadazyma tenuis]
MLQIITSIALMAAVAAASTTVEDVASSTVWDRIKNNDWRLELITISFTLGFVVLFKIGDLYNKSLVTKFLEGTKETLEANFFQVGVSKEDLYIKDSPENYSSYATGRENIAKVNFDFKLRPRNNIFVWILEGIMSYFTEYVQKPIDKVDIVIQPSIPYDNFISAIVSKLGMNDFRKFNYFLSLTRTVDSTKIPESFVFMSEGSEFHDKLLTPALADALTIEAASYIRYIAFTDQATEKPDSPEGYAPYRRIVISMSLPSKKAQIAQISKTLDAIFSIIDGIAEKSITFKSESLKKVAKTRETELNKILKALEQERLEIEAEEKAKLKREEREKIRNLSPEEQAKLEKKESEKKQKKLQKKQRVRM